MEGGIDGCAFSRKRPLVHGFLLEIEGIPQTPPSSSYGEKSACHGKGQGPRIVFSFISYKTG